MSDRITLRMGDSTPDDLEIQRFFQLLDERGLSRQGWVKRALLVGFHSLEKALLDESLAESRSGAGRQRREKPNTAAISVRKPTADAVVLGDNQRVHTVVTPNESPRDKQDLPVAPEAAAAPMDAVAPATAAPSWYPVESPAEPVEEHQEPEAKGLLEETAPRPEGASSQSAPLTADTPINALLDGPEMQISEDTKSRVRRLTGNFGKEFDG